MPRWISQDESRPSPAHPPASAWRRAASRARRCGGRARRAAQGRLDAAVRDIRDAGGRRGARRRWTSRSKTTCSTSCSARVNVFGRLDIMICNAGFGYYGTVEETPADIMRRMMDVNFMGTFFGARAALPVFRAQSSGHLIIVSSIVGQRGIAQMSGYSATKAAQVGFAESLRTEFSGTSNRRQRRLPGVDGDRISLCDAARLRPLRHGARTEAVGRRRRARDCRVRAKAEGRGLPARDITRADRGQRRGARIHRQGRPAVRASPREPIGGRADRLQPGPRPRRRDRTTRARRRADGH